ncbi:MAG: hypothetical protein PWQ63_591 [Methanolobus sp.]|jgi:bifunctional DNA-binding transcriptional regulator/antitoxin component of YhaV-PrlF toxin-antitoxin module|nr:hypothetical protein [Methanolobus sp.]
MEKQKRSLKTPQRPNHRIPINELNAEFLKKRKSHTEETDILQNNNEIKKKVKISYDGKQFLIRIPNEISKYYNLRKGDEVEIIIEETKNTNENIREVPITLKVIEDVNT